MAPAASPAWSGALMALPGCCRRQVCPVIGSRLQRWRGWDGKCARQFARQHTSRDLRASGGVLPSPQRGKIAATQALGPGTQGCDRRGRQREGGGCGADRAELAHQAVHDAARRPPGEKVCQRGHTGRVTRECSTRHGTGAGFGTQQVGRADLHAARAERQRSAYPPRVRNAACSDDRYAHGTQNLRYQRQGADLGCRANKRQRGRYALCGAPACRRALRAFPVRV